MSRGHQPVPGGWWPLMTPGFSGGFSVVAGRKLWPGIPVSLATATVLQVRQKRLKTPALLLFIPLASLACSLFHSFRLPVLWPVLQSLYFWTFCVLETVLWPWYLLCHVVSVDIRVSSVLHSSNTVQFRLFSFVLHYVLVDFKPRTRV